MVVLNTNRKNQSNYLNFNLWTTKTMTEEKNGKTKMEI